MTLRHFTVPGRRASRRAGTGLQALVPRLAAPLALALCLAVPPVPAAARDTADGGPLREVMAAEFAVSAGRLDEAVDWYLKAARAAPDDEALAARATRYALMGRDDRALKEALALWSRRAPESVAMQGAKATLALRTGQVRTARRELESMLREGGARGWLAAFSVIGTGSRDPALSARV